MSFVKGQSGNPSGRPLSPEHRDFIKFCKDRAIKKVQEKLDKFLDSSNPEYQRWASEIILERAFGRPVQINQNENYDMNEAKPLTDEELKKKALELINANSRDNSTGTGIQANA